MKNLLLISLLPFALLACKENPTPESQAVSTAAPDPTATIAETTPTAGTSSSETVAPALPSAPTVSGPKLMPVDQGTSDASFAAYRTQLLDAVKRRDLEGVVTLANPNIRTAFGDKGGVADLRRLLEPSGMWEELEQILSLGGSFRGEGKNRSFWAPYTYSNWPDAQDPFDWFAVTGANVPLYESQDKSSKVLAILNYDLVERPESVGDEREWRQVKTADGKSGFVEYKLVRAPIGYRAGFMQGPDGKWRMDALVVGD